MFGSGPSDRGQEQFGLWSSVIEHLTATFGDIASRQKIRITSAWATERLDTQNGRDLVRFLLMRLSTGYRAKEIAAN